MPVCSRPLSPCEPVRPSSSGPQRPSPRARPCQPACEPVRPSSGGPQRPSPRARAVPSALRARPPRIRRPSAAISAGSPRPIRPASPSTPRLAALSGHLRGLAPCHSAVSFRRAIPPCHSICETINAKVFCSPEAIKRIMCIYILCFCPSDMSANTKRRVHKH